MILKITIIYSSQESFNHYNASIVEYYPELDLNLSDTERLTRNVDAYLQFIEESKHHYSDVLVFQEATLNYYSIPTRDRLVTQAIEVPDINVRPCGCDHKNNFSDVSFSRINEKL